jgi:hypothetical protein
MGARNHHAADCTALLELVLQQVDRIDPGRALSKFGRDSMLAAEFRTWFYQAFKVDVPFLTLLSGTTSLMTLGELVDRSIAAST